MLLGSQMGGVTFAHAKAFWFGVGAVTIGVVAHIPMYLMARESGYRLSGMPTDPVMFFGMLSIAVGLLASLYGLLPRSAATLAKRASQLQVTTLDDAKINRAHVGLMITMAIAVTIDVMKPTTLAFVMPGMALEYNLSSPLNPGGTTPVAYIALFAIVGTVLGSFLWGWLGDRIGRRASILYAGIGFIATAICGAMPDFSWNLAMCFLMGMTVGGMLPICYTLLAETIPARHRGALMVLIGADVAGAYILTSWLATVLVPTYSWRILWLIGLPTGLALIGLNRWIPESPRFLIATGKNSEAAEVMARFGARVTDPALIDTMAGDAKTSHWSELFNPALLKHTLVIAFLGFGSGLVLFGFNLWMPTNLRQLGFADADAILRNAALLGFPLALLVAWLYGFWSSRKTMILLSSAMAAALFGFVIVGDAIAGKRFLLYILMTMPICGMSSVVAVVSVYSSEVYPTRIRSRGTGLAAGVSKLGGVAVIAMVVYGKATPSITAVALIGAVAMTLAAALAMSLAVETRNRRLEEIGSQEVCASKS
ncbi:MFS transporter [Hyphomicrobium sp.]|jgi:putative MFS transporter|uniref:MFS transporter n=1 Tax=Hyphomicrobium sp. TaxID=82 RepID=UPI003563B93F